MAAQTSEVIVVPAKEQRLAYFTQHKDEIINYCMGKLVVFAYGEERFSKRHFLTSEMYDKYLLHSHPSYKEYPFTLHCSVEHYPFAPIDRSCVDGIDYLLDFDGEGWTANGQYATQVINYFAKYDLSHFDVIQTNGNHDGVHIRVPFQSFLDKNPVTRLDIHELRRFYKISTWFINAILLKITEPEDYVVEMKDGNVLGRAPFGWNEKTMKPVHLLRHDVVAYLEGESYRNFIEGMVISTFKERIQQDIKLPIFHRITSEVKVKAERVYQDTATFPPCFSRGIWTKVHNGNREMTIFALWNYLYYCKWKEPQIMEFIMHWFKKMKLPPDMIPQVMKHKGRRFDKRVSCQYLKNNCHICCNCGRVNLFGS